MASIHKTLKILKEWHSNRLSKKDKEFIEETLWGLSGSYEEVSDHEAFETLPDWRIKKTWNIAKRFLITPATKL